MPLWKKTKVVLQTNKCSKYVGHLLAAVFGDLCQSTTSSSISYFEVRQYAQQNNQQLPCKRLRAMWVESLSISSKFEPRGFLGGPREVSKGFIRPPPPVRVLGLYITCEVQDWSMPQIDDFRQSLLTHRAFARSAKGKDKQGHV